MLVCAENFVIYKNQGHPDVRAVIPRRSSLSGDRGVLIVSSASHRTKQQFFFLAQSEYGDIYKITVAHEPGTERVTEVKIKYFDTIPPCVSICVLKTGFLFAASEFGPRVVPIRVRASATTTPIGEQQRDAGGDGGGYQPVFFDPRPLRNLACVDEDRVACARCSTCSAIAPARRGDAAAVRALRRGRGRPSRRFAAAWR